MNPGGAKILRTLWRSKTYDPFGRPITDGHLTIDRRYGRYWSIGLTYMPYPKPTHKARGVGNSLQGHIQFGHYSINLKRRHTKWTHDDKGNPL